MIVKPASETWFAFPVTQEMEVRHDNGSKSCWHVALDDRGGVAVCDGWKVYYGTFYDSRHPIGWDIMEPPRYVQAAAWRLVTEQEV